MPWSYRDAVDEPTDLSIQKSLFHLSHEINLIQDLQPDCRRDVAAQVETGPPELVRSDSVGVSKVT